MDQEHYKGGQAYESKLAEFRKTLADAIAAYNMAKDDKNEVEKVVPGWAEYMDVSVQETMQNMKAFDGEAHNEGQNLHKGVDAKMLR